MNIPLQTIAISAALFLSAITAHAELRLGPLFRDHAVLQQGKPVPVWGWTDAGTKVQVEYRGQEQSTVAGPDGRWQVTLTPMNASAEPADLKVSAAQSIAIHDVLVGEVWICSGQSNMEWHVRDVLNADGEIAGANFPLIRHFRVPHVIADRPQEDFTGTWAAASPKTVISFSAVAYFFARDLHRDLKVPIGLVNTSWGGKMIEVFMSAEAIASDPAFATVEKRWKQEQDRLPTLLAAYEQKKIPPSKPASDDPNATPEDVAPKGMNPSEVVAQHRPSCLFNGMTNPVIPYAIRGAIWYQGEHNISRASEYRALFSAMITDWRAKFQQGDFPFYFAQLSAFNAPLDKSREGFALLREAQSQTLSLSNTGMAVTFDVGTPENIHPRNKQDVGARLARIAKANTYHLDGEWCGPVLKTAARDGKTVRLSFDHTADGLQLKPTAAAAFELAGPDGRFQPAIARVDGATLVVQCDAITEPASVRYAWGNAPEAALFNSEGLPASPFRQSLLNR